MFVKTIGPATANIMLVGEAPGAEENATGIPFVGNAGRRLDQLLAAANLSRHEVLIANVAREQPPGNKISFFFEDKNCTIPRPMMRQWIEFLRHEIEDVYKPNIVVALGATALWALTGIRGMEAARGYIHESTLIKGQKVLCTWHPQKCEYEYKLGWQAIMDFRKAIINSKTPDLPKDDRVLVANPSKKEFIDFLRELYETKQRIAVDVETRSPGSHIDILGIATSPKFAMSFNFFHGLQPRLTWQDELEVWQWIDKVLSQNPISGQNFKYDQGVLMHNNGIYCPFFDEDIMVGAHILWPETPRSLGFLSSICLNVPMWKHTQASIPTLYNAADAANTYGVREVIINELIRTGQLSMFNFEMRQLEPATLLELQGVAVDKGAQEKISKNIISELIQLQAQLEKDLGSNVIIKDLQDISACFRKSGINVGSHKQLQSLLYVDMGLPVQYKRRKSVNDPKKVTTDAESLKKLSRMTDNPILTTILDIKKKAKLLGFINVETSPQGRIHTCYNVVGATSLKESKGLLVDDEDTHRAFGRWSSSRSIILPYGTGNLQNPPKKARKIYTAPTGCIWISADYVQAEAVVVAYEIGDRALIEMFKKSFGMSKKDREANGFDIHKLTAAIMFRKDIHDITPEERQVGKTIRHANNYCISADTEVLTPSGWVPIACLKPDESVAQWEPDKSISFVAPKEILKFSFVGKLFEFKQKSFNQLLSSKHRMPTSLGVRFSDDMFYCKNGDIRLPTSGRYYPEQTIDDITPDLCRLICAIQADGSIRERERGRREITFSIQKRRKVIRLAAILDNLGIASSFYNLADGRTGVYINGNNYKQLFDLIKLTNKRFGSWILLLSQDCLDALVDETKWWDSRRNIDVNKQWTSWQYYSKHKENCEWIATAAHLTGRRAVLSDSHPTVWTTSIQERNEVAIDKSERNLIDYSGYIYSLIVPSSFYLIRRQNVISVTGNSAGPGVLSAKLGISLKEAKRLMEIYHYTCPQLKMWHQRIQDELRKTRTLTNLLGRRHRFLERWGDQLFRSAYSYKPQSTVGDLLNESLCRIYYKWGEEIDLFLQLHDAVYTITEKSKSDYTMEKMRECMIRPLTSSTGEEFYIDVDFSIGPSWGEMEDI